MGPASFRRLCRARDILAEEPTPIVEIARAVRISKFHFIRQFESLFGVTPHQFRIRHRLDRAKDMLVRGDQSVTEICHTLGFASLGSFSDSFTRHMGESPSSFRRRVRTMVQVPELREWPRQLILGCYELMALLPPDAFSSGNDVSKNGSKNVSKSNSREAGCLRLD